jgi:Transposase DDE domain group 1
MTHFHLLSAVSALVGALLAVAAARAADEALEAYIEKLKVPPGFEVGIFAEVPGARSLAVVAMNVVHPEQAWKTGGCPPSAPKPEPRMNRIRMRARRRIVDLATAGRFKAGTCTTCHGYVFCGRHLLAAKLRRSNIDASAGAVDEVGRIIGQIRARWPRVQILLRADSGFARDELMAWCEAHGVDYVFGLARNQRLVGTIAHDLAAAALESLARGGPARRFADFAWRTLDSWGRTRRVVAKAEHLPKGPNPRFVVTSLPASAIDARTLYEDVYCARGEIENRIKEQQLDLFADRTSAATMRANQLRLWFASCAYVLLEALRRIGLRHTQFASATCFPGSQGRPPEVAPEREAIRLKLLKSGAQVRKSVRRIKVAMASAFPYQVEYHLAYLYLRRAAC